MVRLLASLPELVTAIDASIDVPSKRISYMRRENQRIMKNLDQVMKKQ